MPFVTHHAAADAIQEKIDLAAQALQRIASKNDTIPTLSYAPQDGVNYLTALSRYVELSKNVRFDTVIDGMQAHVATFITSIKDPMSSPLGVDAYADGKICVVIQHPQTKVNAVFLLKESGNKTPLNLSLGPEQLTETIENTLKADPKFALFKRFGLTESLIRPELTYQEQREFKTKDSDTSLLSLGKIKETLNPGYNNTNHMIGFPESGIGSNVNNYKRDIDPDNVFGSPNPATYDVSRLTGESSKNLIQALWYTRSSGEQAGLLPRDDVFELVNTITESHTDWKADFIDDMQRWQKNAVLAMNMDMNPSKISAEDVDSVLYPTAVITFIMSADTAEKRHNRKEFVDNFYTKLYGNLVQAHTALLSSSERNFITATMADVVACKQHEYGDNNRVLSTKTAIELIDSRIFPKEAIHQTAGIPVMSNKEFDYAMAIFGYDGILNSKPDHSYNDIFRSGASFAGKFHGSPALKKALAMAKLNPDWLKNTPADPLPYFFEKDRVLVTPADFSDPDDFNEMKDKLKAIQFAVMPFYVNAGIAISEAQQKGDKDALRHITQKMSWLTKRKGTVIDTLLKMDNKFKIEATYRDYPELLTQMIEAYVMRTLMSSDLDRKNELVSVSDNFQLSINDSEVTSKFFEHYNANIEAEYDEEYDEYIDPPPADEVYEPFTSPDSADVKSWVLNDQYAFKDILELNEQIHKDHSVMLRTLNNYSDKNYQWTPLTDQPVSFSLEGETLTAHTIHTRLDLLEEGNMMGHCVFSYLSKCIGGESTILSLRNELGERVATVELSLSDDGSDDDLPIFKMEQCFAHHNTGAPKIAHAFARDLVEKLNERKIAFNAKLGIDDEHREVFDNALNDLENEGDLFTPIPFLSDAAYLLEDEINKHLPPGISLEDYFSSHMGCFNEIYYGSAFRNEMETLRSLTKTLNTEIPTLLAVKSTLNVRSISALADQIAQLKPIYDAIAQGMSTLKDTPLTDAQIQRHIIQQLNASSETLLKEFGKSQSFNYHGYSTQWHEENIDAFLHSERTMHDFLTHLPVGIAANTAPARTVEQVSQSSLRRTMG